MKWQTILALLVAVPILALFGGVGFLMYQIGQTWDARSTDSLIAGLVATCGGGTVVIGVLLALVVGIPFAIRTYGEAGQSRKSWGDLPPARNVPQPSPTLSQLWGETPPLLSDKQGTWKSVGPQAYDIWEEQPTRNQVRNDT